MVDCIKISAFIITTHKVVISLDRKRDAKEDGEPFASRRCHDIVNIEFCIHILHYIMDSATLSYWTLHIIGFILLHVNVQYLIVWVNLRTLTQYKSELTFDVYIIKVLVSNLFQLKVALLCMAPFHTCICMTQNYMCVCNCFTYNWT